MNSEQPSKQTVWQQHIDAWLQGRQSQKAYCQDNGLNLGNFSYWRTRLNRIANPQKKFIPLTISQSSSDVSLFLPGGIRLEVPSHALAEILPLVYRIAQ